LSPVRSPRTTSWGRGWSSAARWRSSIGVGVGVGVGDQLGQDLDEVEAALGEVLAKVASAHLAGAHVAAVEGDGHGAARLRWQTGGSAGDHGTSTCTTR